ncbi:glycosyltransferase family 4 protein [Patulibacter defluvii]|uniref:glycosyltransferase family 4 protein n=1 Tax=Patulibacter defluvii TaxID=3095358 RepID=UPI002A74B3CB|nr:glycosyltransferase family 4 protein [Patulibacter sp. DM4]
MRRLLLVAPDAPPAPGGIARFLDGWLRWLPDSDWSVLSSTPGPPQHAGHPVRRLPRVPLPGPAGAAADRALISAAGLAAAAARRPDAVVIGVQSATIPGLLAQRLLGVPAVFLGYGRELGADDPWTRIAGRRAALTVTISGGSADVLRAAGVPERRLLIAPPGIEPLDRPAPAAPPDGPPTAITVTRLDAPHKALEDVAAAVRHARRRVPDLRWSIVGSGEPYPAARAAIDAAVEEGWATLHGRVDDDERDRLLEQATVFVLATKPLADGRVGEGFGIVFLEAGARGTPSVAPDADGMRDAIARDQGGLLVAPGDPAAMGDAIARIASDPALRSRLSTGARAHAEAHAWPTVLAPVAAALDRMIAGDRAPARADIPR